MYSFHLCHISFSIQTVLSSDFVHSVMLFFIFLCMPVTFVLQFSVLEHFSLNHSSFVCFYLISYMLWHFVMLSVVSLSLIENFTLFFFHSWLVSSVNKIIFFSQILLSGFFLPVIIHYFSSTLAYPIYFISSCTF